jgi:hypothetical protein
MYFHMSGYGTILKAFILIPEGIKHIDVSFMYLLGHVDVGLFVTDEALGITNEC